MDRVISKTSIILIRTHDSFILGVDSRSTGEWGEVASDNSMKATLLRDKVVMTIAGDGQLSDFVRRDSLQKFGLVNTNTPIQTIVTNAAGTARAYVSTRIAEERKLARLEPVNDQTVLERMEKVREEHKSKIFVVGFDCANEMCFFFFFL